RLEVPVQAVVGGVQLAVVEPAEERRLGFVQCLGERLGPEQRLARQARPEALEVFFRLGAQVAVRLHARNVRLLDELRARREDPLLLEHCFDIAGCHASSSLYANTNTKPGTCKGFGVLEFWPSPRQYSKR